MRPGRRVGKARLQAQHQLLTHRSHFKAMRSMKLICTELICTELA